MKRIWLIIISLSCLILPAAAWAAGSTVKRSGVTVSPAFQEITIEQTDDSRPGNFTLTNNDDGAVTFKLSTVDMGALDDTGGLVFSGLPADYQKKYGLAHWIELEQQTVNLAGHTTFTVKFRIRNDDSLGPGGHYGAIVMQPQLKAKSTKNQIGLSPQPTSLLFVKKVGGERYEMVLQELQAKSSFWHLPSEVRLKFKNTGNVHVVPRGLITIYDPFGNEVARGIINEASGLVLPERTRNLVANIQNIKRASWPGRYRVVVDFRYDGQAKTRRVDTYFTWFNGPLLLKTIIILSAVGYGLRTLRSKQSQRRLRKILRRG